MRCPRARNGRITIDREATRFLTALPVYNEAGSVTSVLDEVLRHAQDVLVVDDGSTDGTQDRLNARDDIACVRHSVNRGYGAALLTAFDYAAAHDYEFLVTIDCDGQHEPQRIPLFVNRCRDVDIVSGSRYLQQFPGDSLPPADRQRVNRLITDELNTCLELGLTDAFCGFKAYRVSALRRLTIDESGYAMPLQLWVQAARHDLRVVELPVPLIYLDENRSFGGPLDDTDVRLEYYRLVIQRSVEQAKFPSWRKLPCGKSMG